VCIANALEDLGEARILAIVHNTSFDKGIGAVSTLMHHYNRDNVTLGAYKGPFGRNPQHLKFTQDRYVSDLTNNYPSPVKNYTQVPTALEVYRSVLNAQPARSVVIAMIGMTTNMRDLLESPADAIIALSGKELVAEKVKTIVWMDGPYNFGCACHDLVPGGGFLGNDTDCRGSARTAVNAVPPSVKQIFSGNKIAVPIGAPLTMCTEKTNPCRQAYVDYLGEYRNRPSWDPIAVSIAIRGATAMHLREIGEGGHMKVSEGGMEKWIPHGGANQTYVEFESIEARMWMREELNSLLCMPPESLEKHSA